MRELLMNKDVVLVLTGCIVPNCGDNLKINNCEERLKQYKKSIEWYYIIVKISEMRKIIQKIVSLHYGNSVVDIRNGSFA